MFGSTILDVAIGLVFVYLLLSLLVTAGCELIASWLHWRADNLRKGLERLLNPALAHALYDHPLIRKLSKSARWPSYIPSGTFAVALVDVIANLKPEAPQSTEHFGSLIGNVPDPDVRRVLSLLAEEAGQDGLKLKENIENWFNTSMDRVAGWYKRKTQVVNFVLAIVLTVAANVDSLLIVRSLSSDAALRAMLVAQAQELVKEKPAAPKVDQSGAEAKSSLDELTGRIQTLGGLGLPVGWTHLEGGGFRQWPGWWPGPQGREAWTRLWLDTVQYHWLGWLLTALAASLGAPFWFDMLSKVASIRSAGRIPAEKPKPTQEQAKA